MALHLRINDSSTGQPIPVRLRVTGEDGRYYPPLGRLAEFATGTNEDVGGHLLLNGKPCCYIDGACEIELPAGVIHIEASHGFEYRPLDERVLIKPGQLALRLSMERWLNLQGWSAIDARAHFLPPHAALLEAAAEDLAVVNLLVCEWQRTVRSIPNLLAFSGQAAALERAGHAVHVNSFNTGPLGRLALLHCHRVVYPLHVEQINWNLADWCEQCHRKRGLVIWPDGDETPSEALADLILGKVDALEVVNMTRFARDDWYALLDSGFHVPLVGSSGKVSNMTPLGSVRTYAAHSDSWIEALRGGRTFVTNGPLLHFTVNDLGPGSSVMVSSSAKLRVHVQAHSLQPFESVEVLANGQVVAEASGAAPIEIACEVPAVGGWWAARCRGAGSAHSSPVYVQVGARPFAPRPTALVTVRERLRRFETHVRQLAEEGRFASDKDRQRLDAIVREASNRLEQLHGNETSS